MPNQCKSDRGAPGHPFGYTGVLDNDPFCTDRIQRGLTLEFNADHVIDNRP